MIHPDVAVTGADQFCLSRHFSCSIDDHVRTSIDDRCLKNNLNSTNRLIAIVYQEVSWLFGSWLKSGKDLIQMLSILPSYYLVFLGLGLASVVVVLFTAFSETSKHEMSRRRR